MSNTTTTTSNPMFVPTMTDTDTGIGWSSGDQLTIVAGGIAKAKQIDNYKKVHVARRRHAKKLSRPAVWRLGNTTPTTLTVSRDP